MTNGLAARRTLEDAKSYAAQARRAAQDGDREAFRRHLQTAIERMRHVTFHLQKQLKHQAGFEDWYDNKVNMMRDSPIARYFIETRNRTVKEGPLPVRRVAHVSSELAAMGYATALFEVVRGRAWYRRGLKTVLRDFRDSDTYQRIRSALLKLRGWCRLSWRPQRHTVPASAEKSLGGSSAQPHLQECAGDTWHFADDEWRDTPALDLVDSHLQQLERLVADAEERF